MDGLEGVDALGTPIRHPEAWRRWRFERKKVLLRLDVKMFSWRLSDSDWSRNKNIILNIKTISLSTLTSTFSFRAALVLTNLLYLLSSQISKVSLTHCKCGRERGVQIQNRIPRNSMTWWLALCRTAGRVFSILRTQWLNDSMSRRTDGQIWISLQQLCGKHHWGCLWWYTTLI